MKRSNSHHKTISRIHIDPFGPEPDERFYYAFEAFEQRLAILRRLLQGADALIVVIGEAGSGKTTMLQRILATTDKPWKPVRVQTAASMAVSRLARLKKSGNPAAFLLQDPGATVILMDDAHLLSRKELRKLVRNTLATDPARKYKRMVLFGEPRISENFDAVSDDLTDETAMNRIYLPTITKQEAAAYIRHRLAVAGFNGKNPLTATMLKTIYRNTAGVPGRINEAASRWWAKKGAPGNLAQGNSRRKRHRLLRIVGWTAAIAAAVIFAGFLWLSGEIGRSADSKPSTRRQMVRVKIQNADRQLQRRADIASISPGAKPRPARLQPAEPAAAGNAQQRSAPDSGLTKPPPVASTAPEQPVMGRPGQIRREQWLLAQKPSDYTIQILGVRSERSLLAFVNEHQLNRSGHAAYYRSRFKGRVWFPLVYGSYPSVDEARGAIAGLPTQIRSMSPWIRKMSIIHSEIQKAGKP